MHYDDKGSLALSRDERQLGNAGWWTRQTMSYDWRKKIASERFSKSWFEESDARFLRAARLFTGEENPFPALMDLPNLAGKRVLEIGCGMGYHSQLLAAAGADLISIDLSETSAQATQRRLALCGLDADVRMLDAEQIDEVLEPGSVDLVWSWGVIHHSAHTARIIRKIHHVLKSDGKAKLMVYHLGGMSAYYTMLRRYVAGFWIGRDLDNMLWKDADGFTARFYTRDAFADIMLAFFRSANVRIFGQDADVLMLPRQIRKPFLQLFSRRKQISLAGHRGSMLYVEASTPF